MTINDNFSNDNIERFTSAQESIYSNVLEELNNAAKESHWMWFIFPQIDGLASSETAIFYLIKNLDESHGYLNHPVLGQRLIECAEILYSLQGYTINSILGFPDDLKFKSSMTLFAYASTAGSIFEKNIEKYFDAKPDLKTIQILTTESKSPFS